MKRQKKMKIVFIIGKYFSKDGDYDEIEKNIRLAEEYAIELWNLGFGVFTPHLNTCHFEMKTEVPEKIYQVFDLMVAERLCDCAFAIPNWRDSNEGKREIKFFQKLGKPVFEDIKSIRNWRAGKKTYRTVDIKSAQKRKKARVVWEEE